MFTRMTDGAGVAKGATGTMSAPGWCHMQPPPPSPHPSLLHSPSVTQSPPSQHFPKMRGVQQCACISVNIDLNESVRVQWLSTPRSHSVQLQRHVHVFLQLPSFLTSGHPGQEAFHRSAAHYSEQFAMMTAADLVILVIFPSNLVFCQQIWKKPLADLIN